MGYSGHSVERPRSVLVILGGTLASIGLALGTLATPQYHDAMTMKSEPVEMTWQQLVEQGLTDNSHVRLVDVQLDQADSLEMFESMLTLPDPTASMEDQQRELEQAIENIQPGQFVQAMLEPIKVYPRGQAPDAVSARVVVPRSGRAAEIASTELEERGTLTGRFALQQAQSFELQLAELLMSGASQAGPAPSTTGGENGSGSPTATAGEDGPCWVYEPVEDVPRLADARQTFWFGGLVAAAGLVICGAGAPSLSCCIFFFLPSLLSILGYPLRYGRGGRMMRTLYAGVGVWLLSWAYQMMMVEGRFGQLDGNVAIASVGYLAGVFGAAAVLGSVASAAAERLFSDREPHSIRSLAEKPLSPGNTRSPALAEADQNSRYREPELISDFNLVLPDSMRAIADSLARIGFGEPESVAWADGLERNPALIQLGCQEMVVCDVEEVDGAIQSRLISVLHDGIAIISLSQNTPASKPLRFGSNGLYQRSRSNDPREMLSEHLEQTISMAEKRGTAVVAIGNIESTDVALFARRVLAAIRAQYGEDDREVDARQYGRFAVPCQPVGQLATV